MCCFLWEMTLSSADILINLNEVSRSCWRLIIFTHHLSTIAPVKSSFRRRFHAGDHRQEGKSFSCSTAGQSKTTASNGLDSVISLGLVISFFSFFFFYFFIPFDAPTKQDDPRENKWKFDNSILFLFFLCVFFFFFSFLSTKLHICSQWDARVGLVAVHFLVPFLYLLIASVAGKGVISQPRSPLLFTRLWPLTCEGGWGSRVLY